MARTSLSWETAEGTGLIEFDAVEIEAPEHDAVITQYPVELGADLMDHVRVQPVVMRLTAWVSNTPVRTHGLSHMDGLQATEGMDFQVTQTVPNVSPSALLPTSIAGFQLSKEATVRARVRVWGSGVEPITRVQRIYDELRTAMYEARLFTIATDLSGDFDTMALRSVRFQRTAQMSRALRLELEFLQIDTAFLSNVDLSSLFKTNRKPKKDAGKQQATEADEKTAEESESMLHQIAPDFGTDAGQWVRGFLGG